jgi:rhamnulokinase
VGDTEFLAKEFSAMPSPVFTAAIDLGATSGRVILGAWSGHRLTLREVHRFPNTFRTLGAHDYWDIGALWHEAQAGLRQAAAALPRGAKLASVGVDTWGVDHALLNDAGRLVFPVHAYRDARTQPGLRRLGHTRAALERIYAATGIPNVFYNASLQLEEVVAHCPAIADLATRCLFLPDYFNFLLSGRMENELSIASTSQLVDVHSTGWSRPALDHFRIPPQWFTPPVLAATKLGRVKNFPELAGTQVVAVPGHDTACAYDAMPAAPDGTDLYISSGTWSLVGCESETPVLGREALAARISNERIGDGRYRPLTNVIGLWLLEGTLKDFASRPAGDREWTALISAAGKLPAPAALLDVADPAFANPPSMRGAIDAQLKRRRLPAPKTLAGYTRLICDSLGRGHADAMRSFERMTGRTFRRILIVGGGSKNRLLCQATADAAGLPVVSFSLEGTAVGNIASQLIALRAVQESRDLPPPPCRRLAADGLFAAVLSRAARPRRGPRRRRKGRVSGRAADNVGQRIRSAALDSPSPNFSLPSLPPFEPPPAMTTVPFPMTPPKPADAPGGADKSRVAGPLTPRLSGRRRISRSSRRCSGWVSWRHSRRSARCGTGRRGPSWPTGWLGFPPRFKPTRASTKWRRPTPRPDGCPPGWTLT